MNIQIISDIHLEFGNFELPDKNCDVLIAAGDIGVGIDGLEWLMTLNMPVIYVAGNHEYWGYEINDLCGELDVISKGSNVHYLEKKSVVIKGTRFLGCTLWTDFNEGKDEGAMEELLSIMNDFRYIVIGNSCITPKDFIKMNHISKKWLEKELAKPHDGPTIVVTHHAPTLKSWASDPEDFLRYAYCNQLEPMLKDQEIDLWVHGHIHHASDYTKHGTRVICNPRGYLGYQTVKNFNAEKLVRFK